MLDAMAIKTTDDPQRRGVGDAPPGAGTGGNAAPEASDVEEIGGAKGPDPTRYGDWQHKGRVSDF